MQSRDENRERESKINVVIHPKRHTRPQQEERRKKERKKENGGKQRLRRISSRQQAGKQLKKERASGAWHPTRTRASDQQQLKPIGTDRYDGTGNKGKGKGKQHHRY